MASQVFGLGFGLLEAAGLRLLLHDFDELLRAAAPHHPRPLQHDQAVFLPGAELPPRSVMRAIRPWLLGSAPPWLLGIAPVAARSWCWCWPCRE
jgi:hypothetical protein